MDKAVFSQPWGGLGDNLQFSTLPRLFYYKGIDFYISSKNSLRNQQIYDMVWESNPYVKGVCDDEPNVGYPSFSVKPAGFNDENIITSWEKCHGFDVGKPFKTPEVYHIPNLVEDVRGCTVVELGATTLEGRYDPQRVSEFIQSVYKDDKVLLIQRKGNPKMHNMFDSKIVEHVIEYDDYKDYQNILCSCKKLMCLFSGTAGMASALDPHNMIEKKCVYHRRNFGEMGATFLFENFEFFEI